MAYHIVRNAMKLLSSFLREEISLSTLVDRLEKFNKSVYRNFDKEFVRTWHFYWANLEIALAEFPYGEIDPDEISEFAKENATSFLRLVRVKFLSRS
jgi:beta-xylosidase